MDNFLLSLCIPTYNRADSLENTLERLTSLRPFLDSNNVEIVISNNASTDRTIEVAMAYVKKFPGKISLYSNPVNIYDDNFRVALSHGRGTYLKLLSDTLLYSDGALELMLTTITKYQSEKPPLYFRNEIRPISSVRCNSLDDLLREVSYFITWVAEFGIWKEDFLKLTDFSRALKTKLMQADATLRIVAKKKSAIVIYAIFFELSPKNGISKGYNQAQVFGEGYLGLLKPYLKSGELSPATYEYAKKSVLFHDILAAYLIVKPTFRFSKRGYIRYLFPDYKWNYYYYLTIPFVAAAACFVVLRDLGLFIWQWLPFMKCERTVINPFGALRW